MTQQRTWTLNKWIVLLVLGALAGLLLEIRYTHREVLGEHTLSWTPLIYSGSMLIIGIIALWRWERGGRKALFWSFAVGLIVGPLGLWLHTMKHPVQGLRRELSAWSMPIENGDVHHHDESKGKDKGAAQAKPPVLAPLSFFGLGLLGMIACANRFQLPKEIITDTRDV